MVDQETVKQQIEKLLELMGVVGTVAIEDRSGRLVFNIKTADSKLLIGQYGSNLTALQHLVRLLVRPSNDSPQEPLDFMVDVEDYRKNREGFLEALARQAASRVRETRQTLILKPMSRADRWVIHSLLSQYEDLTTESMGEEPERRIVIKLRG